MSDENHHHVAKFLLRQWVDIDGKLVEYKYGPWGLRKQDRGPGSTGNVKNLYKNFSAKESKQHWPEHGQAFRTQHDQH